MPRLSKNTLIAFVAATLAGACLHFVYALAPNFVTAVFSPRWGWAWRSLASCRGAVSSF